MSSDPLVENSNLYDVILTKDEYDGVSNTEKRHRALMGRKKSSFARLEKSASFGTVEGRLGGAGGEKKAARRGTHIWTNGGNLSGASFGSKVRRNVSVLCVCADDMGVNWCYEGGTVCDFWVSGCSFVLLGVTTPSTTPPTPANPTDRATTHSPTPTGQAPFLLASVEAKWSQIGELSEAFVEENQEEKPRPHRRREERRANFSRDGFDGVTVAPPKHHHNGRRSPPHENRT